LLATGHLHHRRRPHSLAAGGRSSEVGRLGAAVLREPRFGLAVLIGAVVGTPGALYITALHRLVNSKSSTAVQALAAAGFVVIEYALVIIAFAFLIVRPEATERAIQRFKDWLTHHARQVLTALALLVGGYMVLSGTLRLLG